LASHLQRILAPICPSIKGYDDGNREDSTTSASPLPTCGKFLQGLTIRQLKPFKKLIGVENSCFCSYFDGKRQFRQSSQTKRGIKHILSLSHTCFVFHFIPFLPPFIWLVWLDWQNTAKMRAKSPIFNCQSNCLIGVIGGI